MSLRARLIAIAVAGGALVALSSLPSPLLPLSIARAVLGFGFVLLLPGYALQAALFPRSANLGGVDRLSLSFGLSLAILSPIAYLLDGLPWGIRLWPIVVALGTWTAVCLSIAWLRRRRLGGDDIVVVRVESGVAAWWASRSIRQRLTDASFLLALLLVTGAAIAVAVTPRPGERMTEFYVLGPDGLAESYPREVEVGKPVDLVVGIASAEAAASEYRVEVVSEGRLLGASDSIRLDVGEKAERTVRLVPDGADPSARIDLLLFRDAGSSPYRSLRLWMSVRALR